jgi:hypothetical protein
MDFIDGPHYTIIDPRREGDPQALRAKARSLVDRFEKLGRDRDSVFVAVSGLFFSLCTLPCYGCLTAQNSRLGKQYIIDLGNRVRH